MVPRMCCRACAAAHVLPHIFVAASTSRCRVDLYCLLHASLCFRALWCRVLWYRALWYHASRGAVQANLGAIRADTRDSIEAIHADIGAVQVETREVLETVIHRLERLYRSFACANVCWRV